MTDKDKKNMVKARLLVLSEMFCEKTDDEHPMDTFEIIDYLTDNGVPANTKTLRSDIALLRQRGMDIVTIIGKDGDEEITADEMADLRDTISYEVTCNFGMRLEKVYIP